MLSVIIPTYNERENIGPLVKRLAAAMEDYEVIFVDDNSPDGTGGLIEALSRENPCLRIVKRKGKLGLSGAVAEGARAARGEIILVMDADLSHPPEKAAELVSALSGCDLAIGSRLARGGGVENWPIYRRIISSGAELLARIFVNCKTTDPLSGFFAIRKPVFLNTRLRTRGYKLLLNILADNPGIRICDIPYFFRDRNAGKTKLGPSEVANYLADLFRIRFGAAAKD